MKASPLLGCLILTQCIAVAACSDPSPSVPASPLIPRNDTPTTPSGSPPASSLESDSEPTATSPAGTSDDYSQFWPLVVAHCKENDSGYLSVGSGRRIKYQYLIAPKPDRWSAIQVERMVASGQDFNTAKIELFNLASAIPWKPMKDLQSAWHNDATSGETEYLEWLLVDKSGDDNQFLELQFRYRR